MTTHVLTPFRASDPVPGVAFRQTGPMTLYDRIGSGYAGSRPADSRITDRLVAALRLPPGASVLDVGAGTGKYSSEIADRGYRVVAVEPSAVMRSQSQSDPRVRWIEASAAAIPLSDNSLDGAIIVLAMHHFPDRSAALQEILRVIGTGPLVIFTFEPSRLQEFWMREYFRPLRTDAPSPFWRIPDVADEVRSITGRRTEAEHFPLPPDLKDRFEGSAWAKPEDFLDPFFRNGISYFARLPATEVVAGCERLAADLKSGVWDKKHGHLRTQATFDAGYRFITAR